MKNVIKLQQIQVSLQKVREEKLEGQGLKFVEAEVQMVPTTTCYTVQMKQFEKKLKD